ncbi:MAG: hypothetical protein WAL80_23305 [Xanthobacteraceae bacterium]|jgi:hypothetical protein
MKFALNRYNVNDPLISGDPPPIPNISKESHPFGEPPFEVRSIWVFEMNDFADITRMISSGEKAVELSLSGYCSGSSLAEPGERLFGISLYDNLDIDPWGHPIRIVRKRQS